MAASSADNMQTELSTDDAATQPPYPERSTDSSKASHGVSKTSATGERKRATGRRPATAQRVRTVRLTTQVHPDMVVPYLYGERGGRSINAIVNATGCTIDYCALSPDEPELSPQSLGFVMNFLVSAGSGETLEEATRQLRTLVERVQLHLQKKARGGSRAARAGRQMLSPRLSGAEAAETQREAISDERWTNSAAMEAEETSSSWDAPSMQRVYYAPGGPRVRRERPIYRKVTDVEADEKSEFVMTQVQGRRAAVDATGAEAAYLQQQRGQSPTHFVTRRRVRRYPDHSRWTPRNYPAQMRGEAGYAMYAVASPQGGNEQSQRISRNRQSRHIYQGAPKHFTQTEYNPYEYDDPGDENDAEFPAYDEAADLTNENAGSNEATEYVDVPDQHQPVHRTHHRRSLKRPLSKMRSDGPPPPPIYRQRIPYIYGYAYGDEDDEWMTEDEEMNVAYGYPPQFRPVEIPVVRRRRRFDSVSSQQWSSPAGRGPQQMYKRRRIPQDGISLEHEMTDASAFEVPIREHVIPPPPSVRTALVDQLNEVADNASTDILSGHAGSFADRAQIPVEDGPTMSSPSVTRTDNAVLDAGKQESSTNENIAMEDAGGVLVDSTANREPDSLTREPVLEQQISSSNEEEPQSTSDNAIAEEQQRTSIGRTSQSEVMPLDSNVSIQETAAFVSVQRSAAPTNPPTRKTPESRVASPPSYVANDADCNVTSNAMDYSARGSQDSQAVSSGPEGPLENELPVQAPVFSETTVQQASRSQEGKLAQPMNATPVENVVTDTIRINNHVIASLERMNKVEADFLIAKTSLTAQEDKFRRVENSSKSRRRLEVLCGIVYDLQCRVGSHSCGLNESRKHDLLSQLDNYLENVSIQTEQTLQEKVDALQVGLEHVLAMDGLIIDNQVVDSKAAAPKLNAVANNKSCTMSPIHSEEHHGKADDADAMNWEDDDWIEEGAPVDPASESEEQENFVAQISSEKSNLKFEGDFLAVKMEEGTSPRWPPELPPFVWSLLARVISSDPQSYVMRVTHKRLLDEIAKGDPYYYLHPAIVSKDAEVFSPLRSSPSLACEFGCRGASALKWERKLVSQISSRMKSFDNVAYSLARSSGGKEVLNRKKMNSIIRKLHLVAMQLHSLVSHLYCVKGQATCKEVDSLPIALNNSHFERKMGVYKSRLKLVVPHKYQQQTQQQQSSSNEPAEELLRDTYEFFPELLLCVDIWGYNYRESQAKRHNSKSLLGDKIAGSGAGSEGALFPLGFFRRVESLAFDFEHDSNGLLRCICDELLNIVCLWNDFKWADNLEAVALDRVVSFESDVTASILKILELYAHHLQALWSVRLLDEPEQLRSVHFTQLNAYYSDRSQGSLNRNASPQSRTTKNPGSGLHRDSRTVDQLVANEIVEQRLAEEYWNRKVTALSIHNPDDDAMEVDADPKPSQLLSVEAICSWDQQTLVSYLLRWSDVYAIRSEVNALSAVTNHMMKHEVQKYRFVSEGVSSETSGGDANKTVIDSSTRQLLAAVNRAQMLTRDALIGTEKIALHSASNQLPDEIKHPAYAEAELEVDETSGAVQNTRSSSMEDTLSFQATARSKDANPHANDAASETEFRPHAADESTSKDADSDAVGAKEDVNFEAGVASEQPELNDLIQLLAVTKQDMQELCGHRPRSARMREKVQMQSLQLARQTVEIFRNIRNMYASQRQ